MAKKKLKQRTFIIGIIAILLLSIIAIFGTQFAVVSPGDEVRFPIYSNIECAVCSVGNLEVTGTPTKLDAGTFGEDFGTYVCSAGDITFGTRDYFAPKGCDFTLTKKNKLGETGAYLCDFDVRADLVLPELEEEIGIGDGDFVEGCQRIGDDDLTDGLPEVIKAEDNQVLYVLTEEEVSVQGEFEPFCLRILESNNQLTQQDGCSKDLLVANSYDIPSGIPDVGTIGIQNTIENVVTGYSSIVDSINIVTDPQTGESLWLERQLQRIQTCKIEEDKNGKLYVSNDCQEDNRFICVPSQPPSGFICNGGTDLLEISQGEACGADGLLGYRIVGDEKCQLLCVNGKQEFGNCAPVGGTTIPTDGGELPTTPENLLPLLIIIVVGVFAVIIALIVTRRK